MENSTYSKLNEKWKATGSIILGGEVPALDEVKDWLLYQKQKMGHGKSEISGEGVVFPSDDYADGCRSINFNEMGKLKMAKANINDVKDIDSLIRSTKENFVYCANVVLGNSANVNDSTDVSDSHFILNSARVNKSSYVAFCTIVKECEYLFGCNVASYDKYCLRCHQFTYNTRCMEATLTTESSDCYYTQNCMGCQDCFFSFNQRNGRQMVGNLQLDKEKYGKIKSALLEQMRGELKSKKKLPSLTQIMEKCEPKEAVRALGKVSDYQVKKDGGEEGKAVIEKMLEDTSKVVLGKGLKGLDGYGKWLGKHTLEIVEVESALGSGKLYCPTYENYKEMPKKAMVNVSEAFKVANALRISEGEAGEMKFENAPKIISKIMLTTPEFIGGKVANSIKCPISLNTTNVYRVHGAVLCKNCAFSTWPNGSEAVFGCAFAMDSSYCINCYNSFNLKRCFECDSSRDCSDCYFSHNIENCQECLFCFNVKAKRYAIGNVEVGKEEYLKVKKMVLEEIGSRLEKEKKLDLDIYNLSAKR